MKRDELAGAVMTALPEGAVVVCGMGSTSIAWRRLESAIPAYFTSDPMGLGPSVALGVALSRPDTEVMLLQGDGELILALSSLVTIAAADPANLRIVVFHNQHYETGGRRPLPVGPGFDLAEAARGAGFERVWAAEGVEAVNAAIGALVASPGPGILVATIESEGFTYGAPQQKLPVETAEEFTKGLGEKR